MRRYVGAGMDLVSVLRVILIGVNHHLFVGDSRVPSKLRANPRGVEDETLGDHTVSGRGQGVRDSAGERVASRR